MRLTTWNVNGIRNPFSYPPWNQARTFSAMFDILESDIVVMQELKIQRKDLRDDMVLVDGWDCYFSLPKHKKGYSGVGIYTRNAVCAPVRAEEGLLGVLPSGSGVAYRDLPDSEHIGGYPTPIQITELGVDPAILDAEGRCVVVEFPAFVLFGVYSPANSNGLRDDFRYGFICALDCRIRNLIREGKNVVLVGDLNVSRHEIDSAAALEEIRKSQATREEYLLGPNRRIFNQLLIDGEVIDQRDEGRETGVLWDTTRAFHPERKGMYTHWETKINARPGNYGSRIDFVLVSSLMQSWIKDANIQEGLLGSDHCPVYADFHDEVEMGDRRVNLLDAMNSPGYFENGERKIEWKLATTPAFSAKRMPEFDKRRSIKSMFAAPTLKKTQTNQQTSAKNASGTSGALATSTSQDFHDSFAPQAAKVSRTTTSPVKRNLSSAKDQTVKRQKVEPKSTAGPRGQQSLKGFFQAKNPPAAKDQSEADASNLPCTPPADISEDANPSGEAGEAATAPQTPASIQQTDDENASPSPRQFAAQMASAEQTQKSWGALFAKPAAPLCESHAEPCKTMQTKKKGSNQGRSFWMCARPLGPSGEKERGTQWRCATFIWCSDWQPKKEGGTASPVKAAGE
ncbi:DNA lyase [Lecanosticta acicola]|uniref:DNA-(apurinic or apyrimidinic site) endonuclease 2 n=1 Tax=Lecanosticta acicola TaxID=111012 RepID=A0AAI8YRI3_9PEZI|nr:DNA lyase [Lecanosticta acicola]